MHTSAYRDLRLLTELSSDILVTQRSLAKKQGLALGLMNLLIRRLVKKGYVKIVSLKHNRLRYLITPQGIAEKVRLTHEYLEYAVSFYRQLRAFLMRTLSLVEPAGGKDILLYGAGEAAEIAFLVAQQMGFNVVAVVDEGANGEGVFLNRPIKRLAELSTVSFDWVVVASLKDRQQAVQALLQGGVPWEKIIAIPDEHPPGFNEDDLNTVPGSREVVEEAHPA
jgi:DNA-binding MarR family transcriptional regulator